LAKVSRSDDFSLADASKKVSTPVWRLYGFCSAIATNIRQTCSAAQRAWTPDRCRVFRFSFSTKSESAIAPRALDNESHFMQFELNGTAASGAVSCRHGIGTVVMMDYLPTLYSDSWIGPVPQLALSLWLLWQLSGQHFGGRAQ
jgi:hypothetical protein